MPEHRTGPEVSPPAAPAARVVVAGALLRGGRLLAARRSAPAALAGGWELPGGKVEPDELPEQALVRELREELGVLVRPLRRLPGAWPIRAGLVLHVWTVELLAGEPEPLEDHSEVRWLEPAEVPLLAWLPQDVEPVRLLLAELGAPEHARAPFDSVFRPEL
ncbi:(deoxy)nucleoside triphosphate pyrophosphohydrolase [Allostreptomyces psammosilenae]|uniref:8-oxo-dGTP diphosphatase n=1 Tax=Allostreptomyces psammosilenae TaxID=1892865 RepID=A0A853A0Y9_9ACTN|nr:(deoxy)nucleoside triphosphate pyrophosphohydrolase [Allostreptomyces psammosilenae]NYI08065.1 8-oxo-dGTP diphosphatase [Allostreptomyces psammosilenae]